MAIAGNLRTMQLSELLQWLSTSQKTGTLVVRGPAGEKRIYFANGRVTSSSSTLEREHLGRFLVGFGYISDKELTRALEVQHESKILLGKILVMIGAIHEEELTELLRLKAAETIYDIFLWTEGSFAFIDGEVPSMSAVSISSDVTGIVMEGLRRYDEWQRIKQRIQTMREIPEVVVPVETGLGERENMILKAINGQSAIDQIAMVTHNPDFYVAKLVYDLVEAGHVRLVGERPETPARQDAAEVSDSESERPVFAEPLMPALHTVFSGALTQRMPVPEHPQATPPKEPAAASRVIPAVPNAPAPTPEPPAGPEEYVLAPPGPQSPLPQDFARFLRRGPDSAPKKGSFAKDKSDIRRTVATPSPAAPPARTGEAGNSAAGPSAVTNTAVPRLTKPMEELMSHSFTPNEAFIVSRINGLWDVKSIARISPFPEAEVLRVFAKLYDAGVISWK
jgi:hypothetical protein